MEAAARSKAGVCGQSFARIAGLNAAGDMDVCPLWVLCVVRCRSLRLSDRSSRGALQSAVCLSVIVKPPEGPGSRGAVAQWAYINTATNVDINSTLHIDLLINANQVLAILNHSPPHQIYNRPTDTASVTTRNSPTLMTD